MYRATCTVPLPPSLGHTLSRLHSTQLLLHVSHLTSLLLPLVGRLQFAVFGFINSENAYKESDFLLHENSLQTCLGFGKQSAHKLNHTILFHFRLWGLIKCRIGLLPPRLQQCHPLHMLPPRPSDLPMNLTFSAGGSPVLTVDLSQLQQLDTMICSPVLEILIPGFPRWNNYNIE